MNRCNTRVSNPVALSKVKSQNLKENSTQRLIETILRKPGLFSN